MDRSPAHHTALSAESAGFSTIPPKDDGSKAPLASWKQYQHRRATPEEIDRWYANGRTGVGIVCGAISGNVELFEFDDGPTYQAFLDAAGRVGLGDLVTRIRAGYEETTPGGGIHWLYRCVEISGNTKLAHRPKQPEEMKHSKDEVKVLIETRGNGGYAVLAPSNGRVHPTGGTYQLTAGSLAAIATITREERSDLWQLARTFDQMPLKGTKGNTRKLNAEAAAGGRPGDDFNARAVWANILQPHGWMLVFEQESEEYWRRPGKERGISATTNYNGSGLLYVFTTSTEFEPQRVYSKFSAYALLNHNGDFAAAARELREQEYGSQDDVPFFATTEGLFHHKQTSNGKVTIKLANFHARVVQDVVEDDGSGELRRTFSLAASRGSRQFAFDLPAEKFAAMNWVTEHLGASAIIEPEHGARDLVRVATQKLSGDIPEHRRYTATGMRQIDGVCCYLTNGGAIGPDGTVPGVDVQLTAPLDKYTLPSPPAGEELQRAIRASLSVLDVAAHAVTAPLLAADYRAPLGSADFSVHLPGRTGTGKTELAALSQQHYGSGMNARNLPGSWSSTANSLEAQAFLAKDAVLVVDDFAPTGTTVDVARLHREADRLLRAQGNSAGRQRMRADTSLRPARSPRGLIISTGEDVPRGESLRARLVVLEVGPDTVDWKALTRCQAEAGAGLYAAAMAGYVRWLCARYDSLRTELAFVERALREAALASGAHRRTPDNVAKMAAGWKYFLRFAVEAGALSASEAKALFERVWHALGTAAAAQAQQVQASDPVRRFLDLLRSAITGGNAHVASLRNDESIDGHEPTDWGWESQPLKDDIRWHGKGTRVGWLDNNDLYLDPDSSFTVAQQRAQAQGESLPLSPRALHKQLCDRRLLLSREENRERYTIRMSVGKERLEVLHLNVSTLLNGEPSQPSQPSPNFPEVPCSGVEYTTDGTVAGDGQPTAAA